MSDEGSVLKNVWLSVAHLAKLFRVNTGQGWIGKGKGQRLPNSSVIVPFARPISIGFTAPDTKPVKGVADLIGWTSVEISKYMVGQKVAIFTSIECKNSKGGVKAEDQINWMQCIKAQGGIAGFAKSPQEAEEIIVDYLREKNNDKAV